MHYCPECLDPCNCGGPAAGACCKHECEPDLTEAEEDQLGDEDDESYLDEEVVY